MNTYVGIVVLIRFLFTFSHITKAACKKVILNMPATDFIILLKHWLIQCFEGWRRKKNITLLNFSHSQIIITILNYTDK